MKAAEEGEISICCIASEEYPNRIHRIEAVSQFVCISSSVHDSTDKVRVGV